MSETANLFHDQLRERFDSERGLITFDASFGGQVDRMLTLLNVPELAVTSAVLGREEGSPSGAVKSSVVGKTVLWGAEGADIAVTFEGQENPKIGLQADVPSLDLSAVGEYVAPLDAAQTAALSGVSFKQVRASVGEEADEMTLTGSTPRWDFLDINGVKISAFEVTLTVKTGGDGGEGTFGIQATGKLDIAGTGIPVEVDLPNDVRGARVRVPAEGVDLPSLPDAVGFMAGADAMRELPSEFAEITACRLTGLSAEFDPQKPGLPAAGSTDLTAFIVGGGDPQYDPQKRGLRGIHFELATAERWELAPELAVGGLSLNLNVGGVADAATGPAFRFRGTISGEVSIGGLSLTASVPVPFANPATLEVWTDQPASLLDFAGLAGDLDLASIFPEGLDTGALALQHLKVAFDLKTKRLISFGFAAASAGEWAVIPDYLVIENLEISLDVSRAAAPSTVVGSVGGSVCVNGVRVSAAAERLTPSEGWTLRLTEALPLPDMNSLAGLMGGQFPDGFLPEGMGESVGALTLYEFALKFDPAVGKLSAVSAGVMASNEWVLVPDLLALRDFILDINVLQPTDGRLRQMSGRIGGAVAVGEFDLWVNASKSDGQMPWVLSGGSSPGSTIKLSAITQALLDGIGQPDELPDLEFSNVSISITPSTGEVTLAGTCTAAWDLPFGVSGLAVSRVDLSLRRGPKAGTGPAASPAPVSCSLRLSGEGPAAIVEGLVFKSLALNFNLDERPDGQAYWTLSGSVAANIFDADYTLNAGLEMTPAQRKLGLSVVTTTAVGLVNIEGVGSLSAKNVAINIVKPLQPAASQGAVGSGVSATGGDGGSGGLSLSPDSPYLWDVTITGGLKVTDVIDLEGTLQFYKRADRTGLDFKAQQAQVRIPLPVPSQSIDLRLGLTRVSVVRLTTAAGASAWAFDAAVEVWFTGLPESLQKILAQKVSGQFKVDDTGAQVSVSRLLEPLELELPDAKVGDANIEFGTMLLDASNLMLRIQGGNLTLSMDFGAGLPEKLNNVFGKREDGTPSTRFFNTYVKGKPETVTKFRLGIDTVGGLTIQTVTSPIAAVRVVMEGPNAWWYVDLGEFGKAKLMVPVFSYTGDGFVARGGFQQLEPLKVPLTPFKLLLSACGLGAAADALPAGLPLQEIELYDEGRKDFNIDEFFTTLERLGGFSLPSEVKDALRFIEGRLDLLPDRFKSYLDVEIPERFEFSFAVQPGGGASGRVWVQGDKPVKLLYPTVGAAGPQLNGIELYGLTFGEMLGGSLAFLRVDARVDQFDLLMLAAALALPLEQLPILPSTRALSRRFIIKDLFMFIVYQAGVPVPVPLFYDELGLEYLGIEGLEFQTHWGFPKPALSPSEALDAFHNFERFFTEHDYLLDASAPPQKFDLKLTVGPNYFALPRYLGGNSLGSKDDCVVISAYESLAHLLNALKTLSLNEIVRALPLDKRVGREQVKFAAMTLEVDWLVTTPQEFRSLSYRQLKVADDEIEGVLQIVPAAPGSDVQGLVLLLKGSWQIADAFSLATCFGIAGTGAGFATGLSIDGKLSELLAVEMSGTVVIDTKGPNYFALNGHSALTVLDRRIFVGDVQIDDDSFHLEGRLDLFPPSSPLQIGGGAKLTVDSGGRVYFHGETDVSLTNFVLQSSLITVTNTSLDVSGSWMGRAVSFSIKVEGRDFILSGSVSFDLALKVTTGPVYEPATGLRLADGIKLDTSADASLAVSLGTFGFAAEIDAGFQWDKLQLKVPHFRVDVSPSDLKQLAETVGRQISEKASEIFAGVYKSVGEWLKAGAAGVVRLGREWDEAVRAAGRWSQAAWDATAQWSAKAWQSASAWKASAWRATTQWSEQAWRSTTKWTDDAWDATVSWTDDAWEATTRWSDDAWRATEGWSKDAWQATTHWSAETWKDTTRWTKEVWGQTAHWTSAEWSDATNTVEKFFKSIHGDVSFIPHIDTNFIPHGDVQLIPHADVQLIPHVDAQAASHGDVNFIPHGDVQLIPHGDVQLIPHADFYSIPHGDVKGSHVDVDKKKVAGVTVTPHGDSRIGHIDTPRTGHVDTPSAAHVDTPSTGHVDTPSTAHLDTPNILHGDTPSTAHVDTPSAAHVDTPATAHGDTPSQAHIDSP